MPSVPNPLHRKHAEEARKRSKARWIVMIIAAVAAVGWKQRTAISNRLGGGDVRQPVGAGGGNQSGMGLRLQEPASQLSSAQGAAGSSGSNGQTAGAGAASNAAADPMGPELLTCAPAAASETWSESETTGSESSASAAGGAAEDVPADLAAWSQSVTGEATDGERSAPADAAGTHGREPVPGISAATTAGGAAARTGDAAAAADTVTGDTSMAPAQAETPPTVEEWTGQLEGQAADDGSGGTAADQPSVTAAEGAEDQSAAAAEDVIPAHVDETGTFRPAKAETDQFGVTVTDDAPAGLEASHAGWLRGDGSSHCPESHPIKGNASSRIFHRPGESSYEATIPELCFATEADAVAAGYRPRAR